MRLDLQVTQDPFIIISPTGTFALVIDDSLWHRKSSRFLSFDMKWEREKIWTTFPRVRLLGKRVGITSLLHQGDIFKGLCRYIENNLLIHNPTKIQFSLEIEIAGFPSFQAVKTWNWGFSAVSSSGKPKITGLFQIFRFSSSLEDVQSCLHHCWCSFQNINMRSILIPRSST